ncbi:MAG: hypothetical protein KME35_01730 [Aphanocapsa sp. GSE-SYN-MK-11-07L]|jgi:hypothetical protein|nr:hypothetical protein [Aphanocapsa sp. GSE-SYN-MK-11-07L]
MLYLILIWNFLAIACFLPGAFLLQSLRDKCFIENKNSAILAIWLGLVMHSVLLMGLSVITPLSFSVGIAVLTAVGALSLIARQTRQTVADLFRQISPLRLGILFGLEIAVAAYATRTWIGLAPSTYDLGLYHFGTMKWLAEYGALPGLGLIHFRFGFTSAWFALAAVFNHGIPQDRGYAVLGGFGFLLILAQFGINLVNCYRQPKDLTSWFLVTILLLYLPFVIKWEMPVSSTPDLPVIVLTYLVGWCILAIANSSNSDLPAHNSGLNAALVPLILSAGAVTVKLSGLPLLGVAIAFYLTRLNRNHKRQDLIAAGLAVIIPLLALLAQGIVTTGCMLYPAISACLPLPWSLGNDHVIELSKIIRVWSRWSGPTPAGQDPDQWLGHWLAYEGEAAILLVCSAIAVLWLVRRPTKISGQFWLTAIAVLGILMVMLGGPTLRYGLGYFCLLPAFVAAFYCQTKPMISLSLVLGLLSGMDLWMGATNNRLLFLAFLLAINVGLYFNKNVLSEQLSLGLIMLFGLIFVGNTTFETTALAASIDINAQKQANTYLWPVQLPVPPLQTKQVNDLPYRSPISGNSCWGAKLPCTFAPTHATTRLRQPNQGIAGGFVRDAAK